MPHKKRGTMKVQKRILFFRFSVVIILFLSVNTHEKLIDSTVSRLTANHSFSIFNYHVKYIPSQIWSLVTNLNSDRSHGVDTITNYFKNREIRYKNIEEETKIYQNTNSQDYHKSSSMKNFLDEQRKLIEIKLNNLIKNELINQNLGMFNSKFLFPPLFVNLDSPPYLLVVSPKDNIQIISKILIIPSIKISDIESLERLIEKETKTSVLIVNLGGIATYPPLISDKETLIFTMETISHEWFHHYWFFKPLGFNYFKSREMTILNETAAEIAGSEIGNLAYNQLKLKQSTNKSENLPKSGFIFNDEMRETRSRLDELLKQKLIDEAELYLATRRLAFLEAGFNIRKLNQAYFAFYGTYGQNPASSSTIAVDLELLREKSKNLEEFILTVSGFGNYNDFLLHIKQIKSNYSK